MKRLWTILALIFAVVLLACVQKMTMTHNDNFPIVAPQAFADSLQKNPTFQLVDVRTPAEYAESHIANAANIDVKSADFKQQVDALLTSDRPVAVYCRSGVRSGQAADILAQLGYHGIELDGGILNWNKSKK